MLSQIGTHIGREILKKIEKSFRRSLKKLPYKESLMKIPIYTLKYRRLRGDMIEVSKILHKNTTIRMLPQNFYSVVHQSQEEQFETFELHFSLRLEEIFIPARVVSI